MRWVMSQHVGADFFAFNSSIPTREIITSGGPIIYPSIRVSTTSPTTLRV